MTGMTHVCDARTLEAKLPVPAEDVLGVNCSVKLDAWSYTPGPGSACCTPLSQMV